MGLLYIQAKKPYKFYKFSVQTSFTRTVTHFEWNLVAKIRTLHQHKIELSINNFKRKQRNITQVKMEGRSVQTKELKCASHLLSEKFRNMSDEKKIIVRELGFGGLMHIPPLRVQHKILKKLANSFKLGKNTLETGYGSFKGLRLVSTRQVTGYNHRYISSDVLGVFQVIYRLRKSIIRIFLKTTNKFLEDFRGKS
ncbi:hypothetical protein Ahy_A06g026117 [Arachis hypogaea]|uniref:Uncharacterized protein n=1 Tax=Arachis hypogaea TaxID=3818 RepID=A0A445CJF7_ARAHY|nr:hypothetical protein Ahy_A06g026117 [Arachis hypogaea]